jgi:hypothetical protein
VDILWEALSFFVSLVEVVAVVVSILAIGLMAATAAFWVLSRCFGQLTEPPAENDQDEDVVAELEPEPDSKA